MAIIPKTTKQRVSKGINSVEIGYRVLLAVQMGPSAIQLSEIARRTGLSSGAAHNYVASLIRTGLLEQEGRGRYRLGPSAFALSLSSFKQLNGYEILKAEAELLHEGTGRSIAVAVWSQGGPVSIYIQRAEEMGALEFRTGLVPMIGSAVGPLFAAYLPDALTHDLLVEGLAVAGAGESAVDYVERMRQAILPQGYARFHHSQPNHFALAAPVWTADNRLAFAMSMVVNSAVSADTEARWLELLKVGTSRASTLIDGTLATGPRSKFRAPVPELVDGD